MLTRRDMNEKVTFSYFEGSGMETFFPRILWFVLLGVVEKKWISAIFMLEIYGVFGACIVYFSLTQELLVCIIYSPFRHLIQTYIPYLEWSFTVFPKVFSRQV